MLHEQKIGTRFGRQELSRNIGACCCIVKIDILLLSGRLFTTSSRSCYHVGRGSRNGVLCGKILDASHWPMTCASYRAKVTQSRLSQALITAAPEWLGHVLSMTRQCPPKHLQPPLDTSNTVSQSAADSPHSTPQCNPRHPESNLPTLGRP